MPLGIDISRWNVLRAKSLAGLDFVIVRATYSVTTDPKYNAHARAVRAAGLPLGAYHFGTGSASPEAQAKAFLAVAADADFLALDLERDKTSTMTNAQARAFIAAVHRAGRKIGLYHSRSLFPNVGQDWNWVAQWGSRPPDGLGLRWTFWQYQGSPIDRDVFNGSADDLRAFLAAQRVAQSVSPAVISRLRGYIRRLSAVRRPGSVVRAKLTAYRARLTEYLGRGK